MNRSLEAIWIGALSAAVLFGVWVGILVSYGPRLRAALNPDHGALVVLLGAITMLVLAGVAAITAAAGPQHATPAELLIDRGAAQPRRTILMLIGFGLALSMSTGLAVGIIGNDTAVTPLDLGIGVGLPVLAAVGLPLLGTRLQRSAPDAILQRLAPLLILGTVVLLVVHVLLPGFPIAIAAGLGIVIGGCASAMHSADRTRHELVPAWRLLSAGARVTAITQSATSLETTSLRAHADRNGRTGFRGASWSRSLALVTMQRTLQHLAVPLAGVTLVALASRAVTIDQAPLAIMVLGTMAIALAQSAIVGEPAESAALRSAFAPRTEHLVAQRAVGAALALISSIAVIALVTGLLDGFMLELAAFTAVAASGVVRGLLGPAIGRLNTLRSEDLVLDSPELGAIPVGVINRLLSGWISTVLLLGTALAGLSAVALVGSLVNAFAAAFSLRRELRKAEES